MVSVLLLSFFGVSALVIVTPGQDTALTIRNTLRGGRRGGVYTVFHVIRWFGAAYLIFLGLQSLARAVRGAEAAHGRARGPRSSYRQGLVSNLGNPKMAVFFSSLLPQFAHTFAGLLALGLVFAAMTLSWLSAYAFAVAKAGDVLRRPAIRRAVDAVVGAVLVAFGVRLTIER